METSISVSEVASSENATLPLAVFVSNPSPAAFVPEPISPAVASLSAKPDDETKSTS
jgi:hypothetical protein